MTRVYNPSRQAGASAADEAAALTKNVRFKGSKYAFEEIDQLIERWNNRLTIKNLALAKRYLEAKMHLVIRWEWYTQGRSKQLRAILQRVLSIGPQRRLHKDFWL
jgi:hypothetical protein